MGNAPVANPEQASNADVADQQCATFSDNVWMISCRPFSAACDTFSPTTFLFQPDTRILSNSYEYSYDRELEGYCVEQTVTQNMCDVDNVCQTSFGAQGSFPCNSTVLLYVHGFRQTYEKVYRTVDHLRNRSQDMLTVVGFLWPCHIKHVAYAKARDKTVEAGRRLRLALQYLLSRGNQVHIFAHSLGCRVALVSLLDSGLFRYGDGMMGDLFLAAAAVASDSLGEHGEFPAHRIAGQSIVVFHSLKDDVLRQALPVMAVLPGLMDMRPRAETKALGYKGPSGRVDSKVRVIDVSSTVPMHRIHVYIASPEVHGPVLEACELPQLTCYASQSMTVTDQESFSPAQHHDEFVRQMSSQCFDMLAHDTSTMCSVSAEAFVDTSNAVDIEDRDGQVMIL